MLEPETTRQRFIAACQMLETLENGGQNEACNEAAVIDLTSRMELAVSQIMQLYWKAKISPPSPATVVVIKRNSIVVNICSEIDREPNIAVHTASYFSQKHRMSESTIRNHFRKKLGVSLHQYVTRSCMCAARRLKRQKILTIEQIASLLGYADKSGFLKAFRRSQ